VIGGLVVSFYLDLPSGPAIVILAGLVFIGVTLATKRTVKAP